jgi:hypothetical protein
MTRAGNHPSPIQHKYNMVRTVGVCASEPVRIVPDDDSFRLKSFRRGGCRGVLGRAVLMLARCLWAERWKTYDIDSAAHVNLANGGAD